MLARKHPMGAHAAALYLSCSTFCDGPPAVGSGAAPAATACAALPLVPSAALAMT
jgi:hypothetical protein